jgi:Salmonella virulence plasmid 65kDa B protein
MKKKFIDKLVLILLITLIKSMTLTGQNTITCFSNSSVLKANIKQTTCNSTNTGFGVSCEALNNINLGNDHRWSLEGPNGYYSSGLNGDKVCFDLTHIGVGIYKIYHGYQGYNNNDDCTIEIKLPLVQTQPLINDAALNRSINTNLAVGTIQGSQTVSLAGAANYSIPIALPSGTKGVEPSLAVVYNSQGKSGLLGQGWSITGLSEIIRAGKRLIDGTINVASAKSTLDNFTMDGELLVKEGNEYRTRNESFAKITPNIVNGEIESFIVEAKGGQKLEYGKTSDARVSINGKNIAWKLSKTIDLFGNYIEYKYTNLGNEQVINEIKYTGTAISAPYNSIKFEYARKTDGNPIYYADAKLENACVIKSIRISAEGQTYSIYNFKYGFDNVHTYLVEAQLNGTYGSQLNSTLFKYGNAPSVNFEVEQNTFPSPSTATYQMLTGDYDGNGMSDVIIAEFFLDKNQASVFNKFKVYSRETTGVSAGLGFNLTQTINIPTPLQGQVFYNKPSEFHFQTQDFNGDGSDDLSFANKEDFNYWGLYQSYNSNFKLKTLKSFDVYQANGNGTFSSQPSQYQPLSTCNVAYGIISKYKGGLCNYCTEEDTINPQNRFLINGDFDGDTRADYLTILSDVNDYKVFLNYPATNFLVLS